MIEKVTPPAERLAALLLGPLGRLLINVAAICGAAMLAWASIVADIEALRAALELQRAQMEARIEQVRADSVGRDEVLRANLANVSRTVEREMERVLEALGRIEARIDRMQRTEAAPGVGEGRL